MIEDYFQQIDALLATSPFVREYAIHFDKRSTNRGYLRGDIHFHDDSLLHFREFVKVDAKVERLVYVYHYQSASGELVFRYDNTEHYPNLPNAPNHRHDGKGSVTSSPSPTLAGVLEEIETGMDSAM